MKKYALPLLLCGCANTSVIDFMNDQYDAADSIAPIPTAPQPGKSMACFYSAKDFHNGVYIYDGGTRINVVLPGTYSCVDVDPGARSLDGDMSYPSRISVPLVANEIHYIRFSTGHDIGGDKAIFELMPAESALSVMPSLQHIEMTQRCFASKKRDRPRAC